MLAELQGRVRRARRQHQRSVHVDIDGEIAGRRLDIVHVDVEARLVAEIEEARQRRLGDDRIAHDHVLRRMGDLGLRPGRRHHAHRAVEGRQVEADLRGAVGADLDDARIARERRLGRRIGLEAAARVAAGADRALLALHAVDQEAVEVADLGTHLALAEEVIARLRHLVIGEVQNADIDGRDRDIGLLAGLRAR